MADKRWKAVERATAAKLNQVLSGVGNFTPVERIPLLGREGPDLTINESGLVINVKSRKEIPPRLFPDGFNLFFIDDLVIFPLENISVINTMLMDTKGINGWKRLQDWYDLMDKWTKQYRRECISAIFLHRPQMPYGNMAVAIHFNDLRRLSCNLNLH